MNDSKARMVFVLLGSSWCAPLSAQVTQRMSVATGGVEGDDFSADAKISANGVFVAFRSAATNLVAGDTNTLDDVFIRNRYSGVTQRVSLSSGGAEANAHSQLLSISADGRYVAFESGASNLVPFDGNFQGDIFVRDCVAGATSRVSRDTGDGDANGFSIEPAISADGRYVAFRSVATDIVVGDTNASDDVFLYDRFATFTERISVATGGAQGNGPSFFPQVSADARYVVFSSEATNLVAGDTNAMTDVFVRDRQLATTERVSLGSAGAQSNGSSWADLYGARPVSSDGRYVAFYSNATNFVAGDTNATFDVFVRDRQDGTTERVSVDSGGAQANGLSFGGELSTDGRFVAFYSPATNLVPADTNGNYDIFLRDRQNGTTERVSVSSAMTQGDSDSRNSTLSADGRYAAFGSGSSNLVTSDTNGFSDCFVRDREATGFTTACVPGTGGVMPCPCTNPPAGGGLGCDNFGMGPTQSGTLSASGNAYLQADTVVLTAAGENNTATTVFWTGSSALSSTGVVHGAGIRCVTGGLKRLYTGSASGGAVSRPGGSDPSVSARSAALGVPILAGQTRHYFTIYRDPGAAGPCGNPGSTINLTNAGSITWNL